MTQKRLIVAVIIGFVVVLGAIAGVLAYRWSNNPQTDSQRTRIVDLAYCSSSNLKPCIASFTLNADGQMLVTVLTPSTTYTAFYLTIHLDGQESRYKCEQLEDLPRQFLCTGPQMLPGVPLEFALYAANDSHVLARGKFPIIGLLLVTPVTEATATGTPEPTPTTTATALFLDILTPLPTDLSYPNPSYPNP